MTNYENEDKNLISPATTPGFEHESDKFIVVNSYIPPIQKSTRKEKWYQRIHPPFAIISVSALEIFFIVISNEEWTKKLRFDPHKQIEFWRFITYMLLHDSWQHLMLNVVLQCFFAIFLESIERSWKVLVVYITGGIGGALGAGCVRPDLLVGASAGVYALLTSYISYFILSMKYRIWMSTSMGVIIISDVLYNVIHFHGHDKPTISWAAHIFGALIGFLIGLCIYSNSFESQNIAKIIFCCSASILIFVIAVLICLDLQIKKCNSGLRITKYLYSC